MMQGRGANDLDHDDAREVLRYNGEKKNGDLADRGRRGGGQHIRGCLSDPILSDDGTVTNTPALPCLSLDGRDPNALNGFGRKTVRHNQEGTAP
jgi:hypothetical protein